MKERYAIINGNRATADAVGAYLPAGYKVAASDGSTCVIRGEDEAGWTLDGYVLPRLASGLYTGEEVERQEAISQNYKIAAAKQQVIWRDAAKVRRAKREAELRQRYTWDEDGRPRGWVDNVEGP